MAKDRKDFADSDQLDTLVGKDVAVEGTLKSEGDIQINGYFKGVIQTEGDVIVGEHAKVKADIVAQNAYVAGTVDGDITAAERLEILETGRVEGDVKSQALSIEPGGILKGSSKMHDIEATSPNSEPAFEIEDEEA